MIIYHYVEREFGENYLSFNLPHPPSQFFVKHMYDHEKYYPGEPVNIHKQSLINIIQENNWVQKGKGKLPLFCGNG